MKIAIIAGVCFAFLLAAATERVLALSVAI
jgi:hypothetical protein